MGPKNNCKIHKNNKHRIRQTTLRPDGKVTGRDLIKFGRISAKNFYCRFTHEPKQKFRKRALLPK